LWWYKPNIVWVCNGLGPYLRWKKTTWIMIKGKLNRQLLACEKYVKLIDKFGFRV
jgi:hypothetical protein